MNKRAHPRYPLTRRGATGPVGSHLPGPDDPGHLVGNLRRALVRATFGGTAAGYTLTEVGGAGTESPVQSWLVQSSAFAIGGGEAISGATFDGAGWYSAPAPCTAMAALLANGFFPEIFYSNNLRDIVDPAIFQVPWWYRTTFAVNGSGRTVLRIEGVTHSADLWVNGVMVADNAQVRGAYVVNTLDITDLVHEGLNAMALLVYPGHPMTDLSIGWVDWAPDPPDHNMGVWRDLWVCRSGTVRLADLHVSAVPAIPEPRPADVKVAVDVLNSSGSEVSVQLMGCISGHGEALYFSHQVEFGPGEARRVRFSPAEWPALRLESPAIWWPVGYGDHPLYDLSLSASLDDELSDQTTTQFGVRSVESSIAPGGGRQFRVNGCPVQVVGGGWCPDLFLRRDLARTAHEMAYAIDMGLNAVRLEGKLEHREFYRLADQLGLMVLPGWECCTKWESHAGTGGSPWHERDYQTAERSMASEASLLRGHPSVLGFMIGSDFAPPTRLAGIYVDALESAEWELPIVSSGSSEWNNPQAGPGPGLPTAATEQAGVSGMKMWPYDWVPPVYWYSKRYGGAVGFSSESSSGHCVPRLPSLKKMLSPPELQLLWSDFEAKQFHSGPPSPFDNLGVFGRALAARYGEVRSLLDYQRKSQMANYEMVRAQFEAYGCRANADEPATGLIYWMLNSAWPSLNWQLFDYYLDPAAAYFAAKKANEAVHVQYAYDTSEVLVVNRKQVETGTLALTVTVRDCGGDVLGREDREVPSLAPGAVARTGGVQEPDGTVRTYFLELELHDSGGNVVSRNVYWLSTVPDILDWDNTFWQYTPTTSLADLKGLETLPTVDVQATATSLEIDGQTITKVVLSNASHVGTPAVGLHAWVASDDPESSVAPVLWDDNDVTLFAGQSTTLTGRYASSRLSAGRGFIRVEGFNLQPPITIAANLG
jgi:exo-1,4-beta-D-glucosaminidase